MRKKKREGGNSKKKSEVERQRRYARSSASVAMAEQKIIVFPTFLTPQTPVIGQCQSHAGIKEGVDANHLLYGTS